MLVRRSDTFDPVSSADHLDPDSDHDHDRDLTLSAHSGIYVSIKSATHVHIPTTPRCALLSQYHPHNQHKLTSVTPALPSLTSPCRTKDVSTAATRPRRHPHPIGLICRCSCHCPLDFADDCLDYGGQPQQGYGGPPQQGYGGQPQYPQQVALASSSPGYF